MLTLLKRFMDWDIDSNKPSSPMFIALRWKLLPSYLGVMVAILGTFMVTTYHFIANNLYRKFDCQLATLAQAATHNLQAIETDKTVLNRQIIRTIDDDGDLDIPWQDLREDSQSIEWFDARGREIGRAGDRLSNTTSLPNFSRSFKIVQDKDIRSLIIPVYNSQNKTDRHLIGYIRASESTANLSEEIARLVWGLQWGGGIAIVLSTAGGWWLTQQSLQPIEQSFQQLKQFTADASHELRSPLTAIKTSVDVMQSHPERIHPADVKKVEAVASATQQMTRLVEDLLWLARCDGTVVNPPVNSIVLALDELLEDLVEFDLPQARVKGIDLRSQIFQEVWVKGDALLLQRLFSNLLNNALEYTPSGGQIIVELFTFGGWAIVRIHDTGIGLTPEQIQFVFHRFWRADKARIRRSGGLGLGLSIAQTIARQHGGEITVRSQVSRGSCFQIRLPEVRSQSPL